MTLVEAALRVPSVVLLAVLLFDGSSRAVASTVPAANLAKDYLSVWFLLLLAGTFALAVMVPLAARIRRRKGLPPLPRLYWLPAAIGCPAFVLVTVLLSPTRYSFTPIVVVAFGLAAIGLGRCLKHRRVERDVGQRATPTQRMARRRRVLLFVSIAAVVAILFLLVVVGSAGKSVRPTSWDLSFLLLDYVAFLWVVGTALSLLPDRRVVSVRKTRPHLSMALLVVTSVVLVVLMCGPATGHAGHNPASTAFFAAAMTRLAVRWRAEGPAI